MNEEILGNATIFRYACDILLKKMNSGASESSSDHFKQESVLDSTLVVPIIVNASFSCELFLKSMLPDGAQGHELDKLFSSLNQDCQNEIMTYTGVIMKLSNPDYMPEQFWRDLRSSSNNFVEWRYFHEGNSQKANLQFITTFLDVLTQVASRRKTQEDSSQ